MDLSSSENEGSSLMSSSDVSFEEKRAEELSKTKTTSTSAESAEPAETSADSDETTYNSFNFWREPLPTVETAEETVDDLVTSLENLAVSDNSKYKEAGNTFANDDHF